MTKTPPSCCFSILKNVDSTSRPRMVIQDVGIISPFQTSGKRDSKKGLCILSLRVLPGSHEWDFCLSLLIWAYHESGKMWSLFQVNILIKNIWLISKKRKVILGGNYLEPLGNSYSRGQKARSYRTSFMPKEESRSALGFWFWWKDRWRLHSPI